MSESKYGEPWKWNRSADTDALPGMACYHELNCERTSGNPIGVVLTPDGRRMMAFPNYADRTVACVNALAGHDPALVSRRLAERDELLTWAKQLVEESSGIADERSIVCDDNLRMLKAAIAKAEAPE